MKFLFSLINVIGFIKRACSSGLILCVYKFSNRKVFLFLSVIISPINTAKNIYKKNISISDSIQKLGPVFIKFGQSIATRPDIIGELICEELKTLQDKLQPFDYKISEKIIRKELEKEIHEVFQEFVQMPVAAASVAQVHKAKLLSGEDVAVKILRPDIHDKYNSDIKLLYDFAYFLKILPTKISELKLLEAVEIFEKTMKFELNLQNEAGSCLLISKNLSDNNDVLIPKIYENLSTSNLIVLEWIEGININDIDEGFSKITKIELVKNLAISFFNQAFRDGVFHADLHQGNILVTKGNKLALIDFGIIGFLSERDRLALAEILYALINKDYIRVAEIHKEIGFIDNSINNLEFAIACKNVIEPIIGKQINSLSVGNLLESLLRMTRDFGMETQPQLILLQKSILMLEGVGRNLAPEVNMWELADPWIKKWASKNLGFDARLVRLVRSFLKF